MLISKIMDGSLAVIKRGQIEELNRGYQRYTMGDLGVAVDESGKDHFAIEVDHVKGIGLMAKHSLNQYCGSAESHFQFH
ncbi:MAG: hypothetical protein V2I56_19135 [Desulfobacteraceae bacterium]|jgi:hypothetical protein|nr:hypothetical protein [Desulfobacteraceae bacterium]